MRGFKCLCNLNGLFAAKFRYSVLCKCPDGVAASGYNLHSHLYMAQCKKVSTRSFISGCTHVLALSITLLMYGFCQYYVPNFKLSPNFDPNICEGRSSNYLNTYFIFHTYLYILLVLACVLGGCSFW